MKNGKKILCVLMVVLLSCSLFGCSKDAITGEQFKQTAEAAGYLVDDSSDNIIGNAISGYRAVRDDSSMIVTFWEFSSEEDAIAAYDSMYNPSQGNEDELPGTILEGDNFKKYTVESGEDYSLLSRVGNTLMYAGGDIKEKELIKDLAEDLGY